MKKSKFLFYLTIGIILSSCDTNAFEENEPNPKLDKIFFTESYVQLIPKIGILFSNDTIKLGNSTISNVVNKIDTNSVNFNIYYKEPAVMGIETIDSPPPGYTGDWNHTPTTYFCLYEAIMLIEDIQLKFTYDHGGQILKPMEIMKDSLVLQYITVNKMNNVGLYHDLKIGDSYKNIYKYFVKRYSSCNPDGPVGGYSEIGFVMYVEIQDTLDEYYSKIKSIEIKGF